MKQENNGDSRTKHFEPEFVWGVLKVKIHD